MRKRVAVLGAAVGLLALLVGGVSPALGSSSGGAASASSDETNEGQTIRVVAVFKETAEIDNGAQGFSLGDDVVFSGNLRRDGARVGHIGVVCRSIPLGGYVKITGMSPHEELSPEVAPRAYLNQPPWKRIVVIAAGPAMNLLIAFLLGWAIIAFHGVAVNDLVVDRVQTTSAVANQLRLRRVVSRHACAGAPTAGCKATTAAKVVVVRDGERMTLLITPQYDPQAKRMLLGITYGANEHVGPLHAVTITGQNLWRITKLTTSSIVRIFYDPKARKDVSGVVGSYESTRQSFQFDTVQALSILAIISLSLAVVNLFPFLPLDGGHIFWAVAEKIRGRPIPYRLIERASVVGFMLIAVLFIVGFTNDIDRLRGQGFNVR